ncbi:MAG: HlyD family efflux transporter periplasmic adaptor subunit [Caulobacterales bacterium]
MKRALLAFALGAALLASACERDDALTLQGYGEADYLYLSPQDGGVVSEIAVKEGDQVMQGARLFSLDPSRLTRQAESAAAEQAAAASRTAQSGALAQAVREADSQAVLARTNYQRTSELFGRGFAPRAKLDSDRAAMSAADARARQARAERDAAQRELGAANAQRELARERVSDLDVAAPQAGRIERIYRRAGEVVGAGEPVLALLPPANMKIRFFAPEADLAKLRLGARVNVSCDSCRDGLTARISYIAREPQFTPPVIFSTEERDKLVFLVEARPEQADAIRPGLPVDVRIAP